MRKKRLTVLGACCVPTPDIKAAIEGLGKFRILEQFTEGGNSYAFRAQHVHLGRDVFLKVYEYSERMANDALREPRTIVEAMRTFPSENVVELFDAELLDISGEQYVCLQMEFVDGESLLSLIHGGSVGQLDAVRLAAGILNGLAHLHSRRILHRDLKPANVVVTGNGVAKLTDFGSVTILPEGQASVSASKHSPLYVPPEASGVERSYTFKSDLYQVGMVLYELVNGPLEYDASHYLPRDVLDRLQRSGMVFNLDGDYERSSAVAAVIRYLAQKERLLEYGRRPRPYFSSQLKRIIAKACKPDLSDRFATAHEFVTRLTRVNVPNWKAIDEHTFSASAWKGWDWKLSNSTGVVVKKSRPNRNAFRRVPHGEFAQIGSAFAFVERQ
jgi:serine/threonine protein kinase